MSTTSLSSTRRASRTPPLSTGARRSIALIAGLLALLAIYSGAQLLVAGIADYQARAFIQSWEKKSSPPSEQAWQIAADAIHRAIKVYPGANGDYLETLGYIQQWRAHGVDLKDASAQPYRHAALQALREATQARPTWPNAWTALAYAKLTLLEFDPEFTQALQQAQRFGPWRIEANRRIAEIGLIAYSALNSQQKEIVLTSVQRAADYSTAERKKLFELAAQTNTLNVLCNALDSQAAPCQPTPAP
ncbi:MAG: VpsP family polysaccharide biosynthesis protein [Pseudomonas sp.]|jgi:type IV secretory pathway TrbD component|nr:VpsP family polysaccharide biosynthesis protein [Pseudomonas sp.]NLO55223.1 hypothetical protein [Gammaproteobacteria bacterium]